jgi:diketogulonate reductase-like aldo/keto reductase
MDLTIESSVTLNNGVEMPMFGLGVYQAGSGQGTIRAVRWALEAGYRHIDTAKLYGNEVEVGKAVRQSGVPREEIFVTTKLWNSDHGYDQALRAFDESLRKLDLGYIDLYLIHWPISQQRDESWRALQTLLETDQCRAIGVSNYTIQHLEELLSWADVVPAVNQVEFSPYLYQEELLAYCREREIQLEAYSPLTKGRMLDDPPLVAVAEKYDKSPAQILIRWALQHRVVVIPKSSNQAHIRANADVFDFEIEPEDMARLDELDRGLRVSWDPSEVA